MSVVVPEYDAPRVWAIQQELLAQAVALLGPPDPSWTICQPEYWYGKPVIQHRDDNKTHAWAKLSRMAARSWPQLRFELAHETVHLLNPVIGATTWLEEGIAVVFQIHIQSPNDIKLIRPRFGGDYHTAWQLVEQLGESPFVFGKVIRAKYGSLERRSVDEILSIRPMLDLAIARKLAQECKPIE